MLILTGKVEYIDKYDRLKIYSSDKIANKYEGKSPFAKNGFFITLRDAKIFTPNMTNDATTLLGKKIKIHATIKQYKFNDKCGWSIMASTIEVLQ